MTNYNERLDEILKKSPIDKEVPEDIWETIYATWTGLWTDGYGEWDEKQPSDIYPLDELLSTQARDRLKQAITSLTKELVADEVFQARADEYNLLCSYLTRSDKAAMDRPTFDLFIARGEELKRLGEEK